MTIDEKTESVVRSLAFNPSIQEPNEYILASASFDGIIRIYSIRLQENNEINHELKASMSGHENEIKCVDFSHDGLCLASCGRDKSVWVWQLSDESEVI